MTISLVWNALINITQIFKDIKLYCQQYAVSTHAHLMEKLISSLYLCLYTQKVHIAAITEIWLTEEIGDDKDIDWWICNP